MSRIHELKTWPEYFQHVWEGRKNFEIRKDDRGFAVGDRVRLSEWDPIIGAYTGRHFVKWITYITNFGQPEGQVVLSISDGIHAQAHEAHGPAHGADTTKGE